MINMDPLSMEIAMEKINTEIVSYQQLKDSLVSLNMINFKPKNIMNITTNINTIIPNKSLTFLILR